MPQNAVSGALTHSALEGSDNRFVGELMTNGYVIIPNLISSRKVDEINAQLEPHFAATPKCQGEFYGWKTTRLGEILTKAPLTQSLAMNDAILSITQPILEQHCDYAQLNLAQAVAIHPGERGQVPHRDEEMWKDDKTDETWLINVMWALDDFTEENGATRVWPGSHRDHLERNMDEQNSLKAIMPRGSAMLYLGKTTHAAGTNNSQLDRRGIIISYCLGWLRTYENMFLTYPPDVTKLLPKELQGLLGYRIHQPNLGSWNGQDPRVVLDLRSAAIPHVDALPKDITKQIQNYYKFVA